MGFYDVDYSNAGGEQVTPGIYEVYVSDYAISRAQSGNVVVNLFYTVREDVRQQHQGAKINYDRFTEVQAAKWRFDRAAKAAGIPDNTPIKSAQDWANLMLNKDLKVKVKMGEVNAKGNSYPEVDDFHTTDVPSIGRPMPILEHAYAQQQQNRNMTNATNRIAENGYNQQYNQAGNYGTANDMSRPAYSSVPMSQNTQQMNQQQFNNKQNNTQNNQTNLPGVDPMNQRSFANGDFGRTMDISDDDLPF